jgi:hypothetical protein
MYKCIIFPKKQKEENRRMNGNKVRRCGLIHLAEDRDQWRALLNTVMNLPVP